MFSIRDFRRLLKSVDLAELDALRQLFGQLFELDAGGGLKYRKHMSDRWDALILGSSHADIDVALGLLGGDFSSAEFQSNPLPARFAKLVYAVRNAIVHNKETEFHLTYASLDANVAKVLEQFLIPCLEEMCYGVVGQLNPQLWYQNRQIELYR